MKLLSEKHMSLVALATCAGRIYGKRALVIVGVKPREPAEPEQPKPEPGQPFVGPQLNGSERATPNPAVPASWFSEQPPLS